MCGLWTGGLLGLVVRGARCVTKRFRDHGESRHPAVITELFGRSYAKRFRDDGWAGRSAKIVEHLVCSLRGAIGGAGSASPIKDKLIAREIKAGQVGSPVVCVGVG